MNGKALDKAIFRLDRIVDFVHNNASQYGATTNEVIDVLESLNQIGLWLRALRVRNGWRYYPPQETDATVENG